MIESHTSTKTILVTGATGNIGRELLARLAGRDDVRVRAATRDPASATFPPGIEAVATDLRDAESLRAALDGVTTLFLVSRVGDDARILAAAQAAGVEHVVLVSSITVQTHPHLGPAMENAAVERLLVDSGMAWTILRPTQFASNALWWAPAIRESGGVEIPFADIGLPTIHPGDIAAVAALAATEPDHRGRTYALTGPQPITARRQVEVIAAALGQPLSVTEIGRAQARARLLPALDPDTADALLDVTGGDVTDDLRTVHDTVARITGRQPRPFHEWVTHHLTEFR
ncbi:NAD(P)H-binding protein [Nocardia sp. NPDC051833]|uniref:NAD(P)H-binding protein n=1 Tax=Nocardia sp. NPDC051833 TaxID=3155674 RepID=UPI00341FF4BE